MGEFSPNITVANEYTLLGSGTKYGTLTIGTVATELKIDTEKLSGRTTLFIQSHGDNDTIFVGFDNLVTSDNFGLILNGGQGVQLKLDSIDNISVYAIGLTANQKIGIIEGIS